MWEKEERVLGIYIRFATPQVALLVYGTDHPKDDVDQIITLLGKGR